MSTNAPPPNYLIEGKWEYLRHPIEVGDRVIIIGIEQSGTVSAVSPGDYIISIRLDGGDGSVIPCQLPQLVRG